MKLWSSCKSVNSLINNKLCHLDQHIMTLRKFYCINVEICQSGQRITLNGAQYQLIKYLMCLDQESTTNNRTQSLSNNFKIYLLVKATSLTSHLRVFSKNLQMFIKKNIRTNLTITLSRKLIKKIE